MYINPIELLGLSNVDSPSNIDNEVVKKEKRKLFAEIDLSDDGFLDYHGLKLTKGNCEKAIDELNNTDNKEFFYYLANNDLLNEFLINGNSQLFSNFKQDSIFKLPDFITFISPYYSIQYDKVLFTAFEKNNLSLFTSILKAPQLFAQSDVNNAYKSLTNYINTKISEIDKLKKDIENEESDYDEDNIFEVVDLIKQTFPSASLNQLPNYFQSQILKIANTINYLSNSIIWLGEETTLVSYELTGYLITLNIDGLDRPTFEDNYKKIKKWHDEKMEKKRNAPLLKKWASILIQIRELIKKTDDKKTDPASGFSSLNSLFDINELNSLPSFADEIRSQIAFSIRSLSISMWNKHNDIKNSISTIKVAMKINVSSEDALKFKQDFDELSELEKKYRGVLVCHFCEKNTPNDGAQISKTIYKETYRSYIPRRVQFSYVDVEIPRCNSCKEIHSQGSNQKTLFMIIGAVAGVIIGAMADEHFIIGGLLGFGVGWLVGAGKASGVYSNNNIKDDSNSTLSSHPILRSRFIEGWSFSKPSA
jgi:hypothetical protein